MKKPKIASTHPIRNDIYTPEACFQRQLRIRLALAAYAYEFENDSILSDADFDAMSLLVDTSIDTGAPDLDFFFSEEFDPSTGQWIHKHPELERVRSLYWYLKDGGMTKVSALTPPGSNPFDI